MSRRERARVALAGALFLALVAAIAVILWPATTTLRVTAEDRRAVLLGRVGPDDVVRVGFTHSSEHTRTVSVFRVEAGRLRAVETRMEGFGPGLPTARARVEGGELVSDEAATYPALSLIATRGSGHWVALAGRQIDLSAQVPRDREAFRFTIEAVRAGRWSLWLSTHSS